MAHQIVATSVPRGLDGVSGYQTVLKSSGIPPRLFDRLKARSGYSHRFPHGDSRNPVVYLHRIEELGGSRWHVLGSIRDAGSDHTGRSNFLAHMLGIDSAEARGKPGGPAAAAISQGCFLEKWDGPPEPAAPPKTLVAADRPPQPGEAPAWRAAGLDPGLAGDLAAAAMTNRKVVIVTRPGDDVLALFVDAMRLVEPSKRWGVTFNTCAIEHFDGNWKAIRADLIDTKDMRDGKADVIDLALNPRGSADPYARFARGEIDALPWQKSSTLPESGREKASPLAAKGPNPDDTDLPTKSSTSRQKKKKTNVGDDTRRERRPRYEEDEPRRSPWPVIVLTGVSLLFLVVLAAIPFREQLLAMVSTPESKPVKALSELGAEPVKAPPLDATDTKEYREATRLKDAKATLHAGNESLRLLAVQMLERIETLRQDWPYIFVNAGQDFDPTAAATTIIDTCEQVSSVLAPHSSAVLADVSRAKANFTAAEINLQALQKKLDDLEANAKRQKIVMQEDARKRQMHQAFQNLQLLRKTLSIPANAAATNTDLDGPLPRSGDTSRTEIKVGALSLAHLIEPKIRLAVPRDTIGGVEFKAEVVKVADTSDDVWEIRYTPSVLGVDGGKRTVPPLQLASLCVRDGYLYLAVPSVNELGASPFSLLQRSVILVEARNPESPDTSPLIHAIRLIEPTQVDPLAIKLFGKRTQETHLKPPPGVSRSVRAEDGSKAMLQLPIRSLRFGAVLPNGKTESIELPGDAQAKSDSGIFSWDIPIVQLGPDLSVKAFIGVTLPQAKMTVRTEFAGKHAELYDKTLVSDAIERADKLLVLLGSNFDKQVKRGRDLGFVELQSGQFNAKIEKWKKEPLVGYATPLLCMPGHETVESSFTLYLKEQYDAAEKAKQPNESLDIPKNFDEFLNRCRRVRDPNTWVKEFAAPVAHWDNWFWPQFKNKWKDNVALFQGAADEHHEIRIIEITSLAYDEAGNEYEVPLVVCAPTPQRDLSQPDGQNPSDSAKENDGNESKSNVTGPSRPTGSGDAVGLD